MYQAKSGALELRGDFGKETVWATQAQIAEVFQIERSVVTKHIGNILKSKEIDEKSNVQKMHIAKSDKPIAVYSLDIILAVGYRTNSAKAIQFRQWATSVLRQYLMEGYTLNRSRIAKNYDAFMHAVNDVRALLPAESAVDAASVLELVSFFADTWVSLDAYDKEQFALKKVTKKKVKLTAEKLMASVAMLKSELIKKGEATELFAAERERGSVEGIVGNVVQAFGGHDLYPSVEEKAAHLLYFMVKDHPFVDGNKRSGAYAFVWFLRLAKALDTSRITPAALTALTLLVAESDHKDKDRVVGLVTMLLGRQT